MPSLAKKNWSNGFHWSPFIAEGGKCAKKIIEKKYALHILSKVIFA